MTGEPIVISRAAVENLAGKLDSFGDGLPDGERALLAAVVAAGIDAIRPEVEGFGPLDQFTIGGGGGIGTSFAILLSPPEATQGGSAGGTRPVIFGPAPAPVPGTGSG